MPSIRTAVELGDPLEMLEDMASANHWQIERQGQNDISISYQGPWEEYKLHFQWQSRLAALRVACVIDWELSPARRATADEMLARMNERLWLGHFFIMESGCLAFRYTLVLSGTDGATIEQLEDVVDTAIAECDRIYPALHFLCDGKSAKEAMDLAILDVAGEA